MTFKTVEDLFIEGYLLPEMKGHVKEDCKCGAPIIMNEEMTMRRCMDYRCQYHMAQRADRMFKYLNIKGIGPETSRSYINQYKVSNHLDLLPYVLGDQKPLVYLHEIAILLQIDGEKKSLEEVLKSYQSFERYFKYDNSYPPLRAWEEVLTRAEGYFNIKKPLPSSTFEIMITGNLSGYTKDYYLLMCNSITGDRLHVKQVGIKNSARACITENKNSQSRKAQLARGELRRGISMPILTSEEFLHTLQVAVSEDKELIEKYEKLVNQ